MQRLPWQQQALCLTTGVFAIAALVSPRDLSVWPAWFCVLTWSRVEHRDIFRNLWIRRGIKFAPFALPVVHFGVPLQVGLWGLLPVVLAVVHLWVTRRDWLPMVSPELRVLFPREGFTRRWTESLFFGSSAIAQEYLYRCCFVAALTSLGMHAAIVVLLTAILFVVEHWVGLNGHTPLNLRNNGLWVVLSIATGTAAVLGSGWLACAAAHLVINGPSVLIPHLRGRKKILS